MHVAGYSAGGLQAGAMVFMRSNYLASAIVYSGGKGAGASGFQDTNNVPSVVFAHGAMGADVFIIDFAVQSANMAKKLIAKDGFVVDCDDGGGHVDFGRLGLGGHAVDFFETHGYRKNDYGALLPSGWPTSCKILP
ncbi:MAG: hypothetical protein QM778_39095 [Myxococcales bacterium]